MGQLFDINKIREILPHRYPMLLIDRVTELVPNQSLKGYKNITINEEVFQGHFPQKPIYPGVMQVEGMAQAGGILGFVSMFGQDVINGGAANTQDKIVYFMSIDGVKFRVPVTPGDRLEYAVSVLQHRASVWKLDAQAFVDGKLVSQAVLTAMITDAKDSK